MPTKNRSEYPVYSKRVRALKLKKVEFLPNGGGLLTPEEGGFSPVVVGSAFMKDWGPESGGYYVLNGEEELFLKAEVFEKHYKAEPR